MGRTMDEDTTDPAAHVSSYLDAGKDGAKVRTALIGAGHDHWEVTADIDGALEHAELNPLMVLDDRLARAYVGV